MLCVKKGLGLVLVFFMLVQLMAAGFPMLSVNAEIISSSQNLSRELKVKGNKIVLAEDEDVEVVLRGVNLESAYDHPTMLDVDNAFGNKKMPGQLDYIMNTLGANLIRITVSVPAWLGKWDKNGQLWHDPDGANYRKKIDQVINEISKAGRYAVLDMHAYHRFDSPDYLTFWDTAAERYKNNPTVLFGIMNEPTCNWDEWLSGDPTPGEVNGQKSVGHQYMVERVRKTGAKNIIIAGGPSYSGTLDRIGTNQGYDLIDRGLNGDASMGGNGIMYDYHRYPLHGTAQTWIKGADAARKKYPILMGEFGWQMGLLGHSPKPDAPTYHTQWFPAIFEWMNDYETYGNYCNWTAFAFHPTSGPPMLVNKKNWYLDLELNDVFGKYIRDELSRIQSSSSRTSFKIPTASSTAFESSVSNVTDADSNTVWVSEDKAGEKYIEIDLGSVGSINRWTVQHAPLTEAERITADFKLQYKVEAEDAWQDADSVAGNTYASTDRFVNIPEARYVRLLITRADQAGGNVARIHEFNVMGAGEPEVIVPVTPPDSIPNSFLVPTGRKYDANNSVVSEGDIGNLGGVWYRDPSSDLQQIVELPEGGKALRMRGGNYQIGVVGNGTVFGDFRGVKGFNFRLKSSSDMTLHMSARFGPGSAEFPHYTQEAQTVVIPSTGGEWKDVWVPIEDFLPQGDDPAAVKAREFWQSNDAASLYRQLNAPIWAPDGYPTGKPPAQYWPVLIAFMNTGGQEALISEIESYTTAQGSVGYESVNFRNAGFTSNTGLKDGTTVISAVVKNEADRAFPGAILAASLYKKGNNKPVETVSKVLNLGSKGVSAEQNLSLTVPRGADPAEYYIKMFLISDRIFAKPLTEVLIFDAEGVRSDPAGTAEASDLTIDPIASVDRGGEASVLVRSTRTEPVAMLAYQATPQPDLASNPAEDPELLHIDQMTAEEADFRFTLKTNTEPGKYQVAAGSAGSTMGTAGVLTVTGNTTGDTYGVELSTKGTYVFPPKPKGYSASELTPHTVTVTNTGSGDAGTLTISKSGSDADRFVLSKTTLNVKNGQTDSFTIVPVGGIERPGNYWTKIIVSGGEIAPQSFDVNFGVTGDYEISGAEVSGLGNTWGNGTRFDANATGDDNGKDGSYWFRLTGQQASWPQYKVGLPAEDYTGLKKISFWIKAEGDMVGTAYNWTLRAGETELAGFSPPVMTEEYVYCEYEVTDRTGQDFAGLNELRVGFGGDGKKGSLTISQLKFYTEREALGLSYTLGGNAVSYYQFAGADLGYGEQDHNLLAVEVESSGVSLPDQVEVQVKGRDGTPDDAFTPSVSVLQFNGNTAAFTLKPRTGLPAGDQRADIQLVQNGTVLTSFEVMFRVIAFVPKFVHIDNSAGNRVAIGNTYSGVGIDDYHGLGDGYINSVLPGEGSGLALPGGSITGGTLEFETALQDGDAVRLNYKNGGNQIGRAQKQLPALDYSDLANAEGTVYVSMLVKNVGTTDVGIDMNLVTRSAPDSRNIVPVVGLGALNIPAGDTEWKQINYTGKVSDGWKTDSIGWLGFNTRTYSEGAFLISDIVISNSPIGEIDFTIANGKVPVVSLKEVKFNGVSSPAAISDGTMAENNTVEVLMKNTGTDAEAVLVVAYYAEDVLVGYQISPKATIGADNQNWLTIRDFTAPEGADTLKAFVWESADAMSPLTGTVVTAK